MSVIVVFLRPLGLRLAAGGIADINPGLTLWTGITFLVLLVVLGKFAWGPIVKMLAERERTIRESRIVAMSFCEPRS